MFHRDRRDAGLIAPKQNQRCAADGCKHRRAHNRGNQQRHQRGHDQFFRGDGRVAEKQDDCAREQQRQRASFPTGRGVPDKPERDQAEANGKDQLNDPRWEVVGELAAALSFRLKKIEAGKTKERADGGCRAAA